MTFEQLESFLAAVRYDTFFDAAESLHITQSTLSKHIRKLEQELGLPLFDRSKRSASLTAAGRTLYEEAQALCAQYRQTLSRMQEFKASSRKSLRLGTLPVLSQYGLTKILKDFSSLHEEVRLIIEEKEEQELMSGLLQGQFDLIIARDLFLDKSRLSFYPLANDRLVAVLPEDHALAERASLSMEELSKEPFILMHPYTSIYRLCLSTFQDAGIRPQIIRTARMESILSAVAFHEGISLFAEENFNLFRHDSVVSVPLSPSPDLPIGVAARREKKLSPAAAEFLKFVRISSVSSNSWRVNS